MFHTCYCLAEGNKVCTLLSALFLFKLAKTLHVKGYWRRRRVCQFATLSLQCQTPRTASTVCFFTTIIWFCFLLWKAGELKVSNCRKAFLVPKFTSYFDFARGLFALTRHGRLWNDLRSSGCQVILCPNSQSKLSDPFSNVVRCKGVVSQWLVQY